MTTKANNTNAKSNNESKGGAETIQGAANTASTATVIVPPAATPKTHKANAVFAKMFGLPENERPARKDMIAAAMAEAGISKDCAATYLQNFKRRNGFDKAGVAKKAEAAAAPQA